MPRPIEVGDRVTYAGEHHNTIGGIVAECMTGILSKTPRVRVVDFASEMKDEEAGRWVNAERLTRDEQEES